MNGSDSSEVKYVFVCGLPRSGTSVLGRNIARMENCTGLRDTGVVEDEGRFLQDVYPTEGECGGPGRFGFDPRTHLTETSALLTPENAAKLVDLLNHFGFADPGFKESDFTEPEQLIQLGRAPNRIDLLTSITGVTTDEALASRVSTELDGVPVFILGKDALIRNKRAVGRPQDIADLDTLES